METANQPAPPKAPVVPTRPYNSDFERELRLKSMFQVLIAAGFILAAILVAAGYTMDMLVSRETDEPVPVTPYSSPSAQLGTPPSPAAP